MKHHLLGHEPVYWNSHQQTLFTYISTKYMCLHFQNKNVIKIKWKLLYFFTFFFFFNKHHVLDRAVRMWSTFSCPWRVKPTKVKKRRAGEWMVNHARRPVHLPLKYIDDQINWLLFTAASERSPSIHITFISPLSPVPDSHLQRIIRLQSSIIPGWGYYAVGFMSGN